jgi:hypothetical protein
MVDKNRSILFWVTKMGSLTLFRHNVSSLSRGILYSFLLAFGLVFTKPLTIQAQVSATEAVTQGQSKHLGKKQQPWSGMVQLLNQKNQDYLSDYFTGLYVGAGYAYSDQITFYGLAGYHQPLSENPEKVERFGLTDFELGLNTRPFYKNQYNFQISATSSIVLPTSEISQRSSLLGSWNGGLVTATPLKYGLSVASVHMATLNAYEFETANKMGTVYNQPYSFSNILTGIYSVKNFYSTLSGSWIYMRDFANSDINIQGLRAAFGYRLTNKNRVEVYGRWRDQTISNNPVFADGTTFFGLLLTINI